MKTLGIQVREAEKKSERTTAVTYYCSLEGSECPLLNVGKCIHLCMLSRCIYGKCSQEKTPTKRAKSYRDQVKVMKEDAVKYKLPVGAYECGMQQIGEYYYLPYSHMDMCRAVPFVQHSSLFISGVPFVPKNELTPERIATLVRFRPQALMGGEITTYQKEQVPKFLFHLKQQFLELYLNAAEIEPAIKVKTTNIGEIKSLKATLKDIPPGTIKGYQCVRLDRLMDVISWDGTELEVKGMLRALGLIFFGGKDNQPFTLKYFPIPEKTDVIITDRELIELVVTTNPALIK